MSEVTFVYSREQLKHIKEIEMKRGNNFVPGDVISSGKRIPYTEILRNGRKSRYSDAKTIISGELKDIKYTSPIYR